MGEGLLNIRFMEDRLALFYVSEAYRFDGKQLTDFLVFPEVMLVDIVFNRGMKLCPCKERLLVKQYQGNSNLMFCKKVFNGRPCNLYCFLFRVAKDTAADQGKGN